MGQIIDKPWGSEEILERNSWYVVKRLYMKQGCRCSLQYHERKRESIYILKGNLIISYGKNENKLIKRSYSNGEIITINAGIIHRMEAVTDSVYLEASTPELDDVIRLEDDYKRE